MKFHAHHEARVLTMQGLYQWLLTAQSASSVVEEIIEQEKEPKQADVALLRQWLTSCISTADALRLQLANHIDRPLAQTSPVEHAILLLSARELVEDMHTPVKVILNEAVLLAKEFGGTNGFRYVNGVLDKLASQVRTDATR